MPDYFVKHGPLAIWDYYLTNYDDAGNARVLPSKTTFGTTAAVNPHPSYSPETVMDTDGNGTVTIMFNYTADDDRAWFENIADTGALELVTYDQYHTTLNDHLTYTKDTEAHHGSTLVLSTLLSSRITSAATAVIMFAFVRPMQTAKNLTRWLLFMW